MVLGRFMGYSVSDYALATLFWLGTKEAKEVFASKYGNLSQTRKREVAELINKEVYLYY